MNKVKCWQKFRSRNFRIEADYGINRVCPNCFYSEWLEEFNYDNINTNRLRCKLIDNELNKVHYSNNEWFSPDDNFIVERNTSCKYFSFKEPQPRKLTEPVLTKPVNGAS